MLVVTVLFGCWARTPPQSEFSQVPEAAVDEVPAEPDAPPAPQPQASPLILWSGESGAVVAGRLVDGSWQHDFDIPVAELEGLVVKGGRAVMAGGSRVVGSGLRWDCDHFEVALDQPAEPPVVLAAAPSWNAFPRSAFDHELTEAESEQLLAVLTVAGAKGVPDIERASRVDLDGDGAPELLVSVTESTLLSRVYEEGEDPREGDYAGLAVLGGDGGGWVGEVHGPSSPLLYVDDVQMVAVADLDGDGQLELFVRWSNANWGQRVDLHRWGADGLELLGTVVHSGETDCTDSPREGWGKP